MGVGGYRCFSYFFLSPSAPTTTGIVPVFILYIGIISDKLLEIIYNSFQGSHDGMCMVSGFRGSFYEEVLNQVSGASFSNSKRCP